MFKLRRRAVAETAATDQPFCAMCGTTIRVDVASGRCALGHRVIALVVPPAPLQVEAPAAAVSEPTDELPQADVTEPAGFYAGEGLYEAYSSADAAGRAVTWDDVVAPASETTSIYDDYLTWNEPATEGFSSLDNTTDELPVGDGFIAYNDPSSDVAPRSYDEPSSFFEPVEDDAESAPSITPIHASDLLDELDDEAHARRRTVGTLGATVAVTGMLAAAVAILPF